MFQYESCKRERMQSGNGRYKRSRSLDGGTRGKPDVAAEAGTAWRHVSIATHHCGIVVDVLLAVPSRSSCEELKIQVRGRRSFTLSSGKLTRAKRVLRMRARRNKQLLG